MIWTFQGHLGIPYQLQTRVTPIHESTPHIPQLSSEALRQNYPAWAELRMATPRHCSRRRRTLQNREDPRITSYEESQKHPVPSQMERISRLRKLLAPCQVVNPCQRTTSPVPEEIKSHPSHNQVRGRKTLPVHPRTARPTS